MIRRIHKTLPAAVVLAAIAVVGCDNDDDYSTGTTGGSATVDSSGRATDQQGQMDAQTFVNMAASGGLYEVESSRLALEKTTDPEEKKFAQQMIDDHSKANDELKQIAQSKNLTVPSEMNEKHRTLLGALQKAQGTTLTNTYHQQQLGAHEETIALFERASQQLGDSELKSFAQKTLPKLQEHLKMLQSHKHDAAGGTTGAPGDTSGATDTSGASGTTPPPQ